MHSSKRRKHEYHQRKRMIELLEKLAIADDGIDAVEKDQCPYCGEYYQRVASHKSACGENPNSES